MSARRYRAVVAYDGTAYFGFQRQRDQPTIQGVLEAALEAVTGQQTTVHAAGRTDTGVHASGQVIAFDIEWRHPDRALLAALNDALPAAVAVQALQQHEGFHPRFDAVSRLYIYTLYQAPVRHPLWASRAWHVRRALNEAGLRAGAALLLGRQDFAALGHPPQGENTVRTVLRSEWEVGAEGEAHLWRYTIEADAFLHHMVRRTVSALVEIGLGRWTVPRFAQALNAREVLRLPLAPPGGLVLAQVKYSETGRAGGPEDEE